MSKNQEKRPIFSNLAPLEYNIQLVLCTIQTSFALLVWPKSTFFGLNSLSVYLRLLSSVGLLQVYDTIFMIVSQISVVNKVH